MNLFKLQKNPTNTPRGFHVETTWKRPFPLFQRGAHVVCLQGNKRPKKQEPCFFYQLPGIFSTCNKNKLKISTKDTRLLSLIYTILYKYIYYHVSYSELSIYRYITKDRLLKFQLSAQLEVQYNNDGLRNDYGMRINVSCIHNHQAYP